MNSSNFEGLPWIGVVEKKEVSGSETESISPLLPPMTMFPKNKRPDTTDIEDPEGDIVLWDPKKKRWIRVSGIPQSGKLASELETGYGSRANVRLDDGREIEAEGWPNIKIQKTVAEGKGCVVQLASGVCRSIRIDPAAARRRFAGKSRAMSRPLAAVPSIRRKTLLTT